MGELIRVVFGKNGMRCDNVHPCDVEKAKQLYTDAAKYDENPVTYHIAEHMYREALNIDDEFIDAWTNLGTVLYKRKKLLDAKSAWYRALELNPNDHIVLYNIGTVFYDMCLIDEAIDYLLRSIKIKPTSRAHFNIASAYDKVSMFETANKHWREVIRLEPSIPEVMQIKKRLLQCH